MNINNYLNEIQDEKIKHVNVAAGIITKIDPESGEHYLLLLRRSDSDTWGGMWEVPRGKCDAGPNEGLEHCCIREVKEESGLDVEVVYLIDKFTYSADEGKRISTQHNFLCRMKNPNQKVKLSFEHDSFKWISSVGEAELLLSPELKKSISKVLDVDQRMVDYPENPLDDQEIAEWKDEIFIDETNY